jgi:hypothetical protein
MRYLAEARFAHDSTANRLELAHVQMRQVGSEQVK